MIDTPQIKQIKAQHAAVIHLTIPRAEIRNVMRPGLEELMAVIAGQGIAPAGPWFNHHLRMSPANFDFEISVPVNTPVVAEGRVKPSQRPATKIAQTIYHGPYEGLGAAWGDFEAWVSENGYKSAENLWECYIAGPETSADSSMWRTELSRPLLD